MSRKRILFVCTGNICRSPTADGVARHWIARLGLGGEIEVDSAGTHGYHAGERPDPRTCKAASRRGYELGKLRARRLVREDFERFDLLLAMDEGHLAIMREICPPHLAHKLQRFMDYAREHEGTEVPDPYYGGERGFDVVLDLVEDGVRGLLDSLTGH
ncbi:MAG: low molecular weight phosphotyrosine protein phosphatase [Rhodocyclaceae bacterium]|nr:low molecular weight phosphotyrosine protein phosphatase [Rhodocyclaceae bacterium]